MLARAIAQLLPSRVTPPEPAYYAPWIDERSRAPKGPVSEDELKAKLHMIGALQARARPR